MAFDPLGTLSNAGNALAGAVSGSVQKRSTSMASASGSNSFGVNTAQISESLKVYIRGADGVQVCGIIGPGTSQELQCNWTSPFEGEALGAKREKLGGAVQSQTGATSHTTLESLQVWQGNKPMQFNLEVALVALSDPQNEVTYAIRALQRMASPNVESTIPITLSDGTAEVGAVPPPVIINIGRTIMYKDCVIESVSRPYDTQFTSDGHQVRATVTLSIATIKMLNVTDIV